MDTYAAFEFCLSPPQPYGEDLICLTILWVFRVDCVENIQVIAYDEILKLKALLNLAEKKMVTRELELLFLFSMLRFLALIL